VRRRQRLLLPVLLRGGSLGLHHGTAPPTGMQAHWERVEVEASLAIEPTDRASAVCPTRVFHGPGGRGADCDLPMTELRTSAKDAAIGEDFSGRGSG
jgi:hypothetical protein